MMLGSAYPIGLRAIGLRAMFGPWHMWNDVEPAADTLMRCSRQLVASSYILNTCLLHGPSTICWLVVWNIFFHILGIIIPDDEYFSEG